MRLIYFSGLNYPSEIANNAQVKAMAINFKAALGSQFELVVNSSKNASEFFGLQPVTINCPWKRFRIFYYAFWFLRHARGLMAKDSDAVFYFKDSYLCAVAILFKKIFGYRVIFESHLMYHDWRDWFIARHTDGIVAVTSFLKASLVKKGAQKKNVLVFPDAVDLGIFALSLSREAACAKLGLPTDKIIFGYTGRFKTLGMDKGLAIILKALAKLRDPRILFVAVGGSSDDIATYTTQAKELGVSDQVIFRGYTSQQELAIYQKACAALLMPFPYSEHFAYFMSPLKMFEYMASGVPIITSDLPSVRDILDEQSALFVKPDDMEELAAAMRNVIEQPAATQKLAVTALGKVQQFTWQKRTGAILTFITHAAHH